MVVLTNCEESESDRAIEYSEELNRFYSSPSPTYFLPSPTTFPSSPLPFPSYLPASPPQPSSSNSSVLYVVDSLHGFHPQNQQHEDIVDQPDFNMVFLVEYKIQDRGGELDVIPSGRLVRINELIYRLHHIVDSEAKNVASAVEQLEDWDRVFDLMVEDGEREETYFEHMDKQDVDMVYQLVIDLVDVNQYPIQYRASVLDKSPGGQVVSINGSEVCQGQLLTSTPEQTLIFQTKLSLRLWRGQRGQWAADICFGWNWLNTFKTAEGVPLWSESVVNLRGGKDLFDYPLADFFPNGYRAEPTTTPRTEIQMLELPPTEQQENPYEDFELGCSEATGNGGVEAVGIGSWNGCNSITIQGSQSTLTYACREHGIQLWPPHPHRTPVLVDQEEIPLLNSDTLPSDQALAATVDPNSVLVEEIPPPLVFPIARQENLDENLGNDEVEAVGIGGEGTEEDEIGEAQLHTGCFGKRKRKEKSPRGERGNKKTTRVRNVIPLEEILQIKGMHLKDAARHLNVSQSTLKLACREYGINRWPPRNEHKNLGQSLPNETPAVVNQEGIPQLTSDTLPSDHTLAATVDTNSVVEEIPPPQFSPTAPQENPKEDLGNDELEAVGVGGVGTREGEMKEAQLNTESLGNEKRDEKTPSGDRGNKKATGVRIAIHLEDILQTKGMRLKDAAKHLKVSRSTLKRVCRDYNIHRWPPREEHKLIGQSHPKESSAIVDQERIPQLNSDTLLLPSNQNSATSDTNSATVKAKYGRFTIKFRLSRPWRKVELEEHVKRRLQLEVGTYHIEYKDEDAGPSTLKQVHLVYNIDKRSPHEEHKLMYQSSPKEDGVIVKAKYESYTIKVPLYRPWEKAKLEEQVQKRLPELEAGTYVIGYKDEEALDGELLLVTCNENLQSYIEASRLQAIPSTLKRVHLGYNIDLTDQSSPKEDGVIVMANYGSTKPKLKFILYRPWEKAKLEEEVKKRRPEYEAGTYLIQYKDEEAQGDELILIACDEDLELYIETSGGQGTSAGSSAHTIMVFLERK